MHGSNWSAYVNNDPVNYVDLWGGVELQWKKGEGATDEDMENARQMGETIASSGTIAGGGWNELVKSDKTIVVEINKKRYNDATSGNNEKLNPIEAIKSIIGIGGDVFVRFDPTDTQRKRYGDWPVPQFYPQQNEGDRNEKI